ncbi:hypothetical protein D3C85_16180 [compost metagenome]
MSENPIVQTGSKWSLKTRFMVVIAAVVIFAFVADTVGRVYRGEGVNMELLQSVLETMFKLVSSSEAT